MKSSERLKSKRAQRQKARQQKLSKAIQPKEQENKKQKITKESKKKAITPIVKTLLSLNIVQTEKGKQVTIHNKYEIETSHPLFSSIQSLIKGLQQKEKKKNPKILAIIQYSNFPNFEFVLRGIKPQDEKCCICQYEFQTIIDYEKQLNNEDDNDILHLNCTHLMHKACFQQLIGDKHWIKCPLCYTIYGQMTGDQPKGTMIHRIQKNMQCDGYPKGTIVIQYRFPDGQRQGIHYSGTGRTAYLPTTTQGYQVFELLKKSFDRKLTFTIGRSVTTGMDNQVVWNGIHHKTHTHGGSSHFGYPDPTYFSRVKLQLAMKGVH